MTKQVLMLFIIRILDLYLLLELYFWPSLSLQKLSIKQSIIVLINLT